MTGVSVRDIRTADESATRRAWLPAAMAAVVVAAYAPVLWVRYGFNDDYTLLYGFQRAPGKLVDVELGYGRPLMLALHELSFPFADISGLRWLRLASIAGLVGVALFVAALARRSGRRPVIAAALGLVVVLLPPAQVTAAWATCFVFPIAMLLSMWAGSEVDRGRRWLPAVALGLAVMVYQPAAMAYFVALAITETGRNRPTWTRARVGRHALILGAGAVVMAGAWLVGGWLRPSFDRLNRGQLSTDPLHQVTWFLSDALPRALSPAPVHTPALLAILLLPVLVAGVMLAERRTPLHGLALLLLLPAAYAPLLVVPGEWATSRSMVTLAPVATVLWLRAADGYGAHLPALRRAGPVLAVTVVALLAVSAGRSMVVYFTHPSSTELHLVEQAVADVRPGELVRVTQARADHHLAPATRLDEFGILSTTTPWAPAPMVRMIRHEQSGSWSGRVVLLNPKRAAEPGVLDLDQVMVAYLRR